jgi:hypothetical protein
MGKNAEQKELEYLKFIDSAVFKDSEIWERWTIYKL